MRNSLQKQRLAMKTQRLKMAEKKIEYCVREHMHASYFPRTERNRETMKTLRDWEERWRSIKELDFERTDVGPHVALRLLCEWLVNEGSIKLGTPQSKMLIDAVKKLGAWR